MKSFPGLRTKTTGQGDHVKKNTLTGDAWNLKSVRFKYPESIISASDISKSATCHGMWLKTRSREKFKCWYHETILWSGHHVTGKNWKVWQLRDMEATCKKAQTIIQKSNIKTQEAMELSYTAVSQITNLLTLWDHNCFVKLYVEKINGAWLWNQNHHRAVWCLKQW